MPHRLKYRQAKIQEKRKHTPWREFVMEICSWFPFSLYKHQGFLSRFAPESKRIGEVIHFTQYDNDISQVSSEIDWSSEFFRVYEELQKRVVVAGTKVIGNNENSNYNDIILGAKDAYLNFVVLDSQKVMYSYGINSSHDVINGFQVLTSSVVYESRAISKSSRIFYSSNIQDSESLWFCVNMIGSKECIGCNGLVNKSYYISNKQYDKKEYENEKKRLFGEKGSYNKLWSNILEISGSNQGSDIVGEFNRQCENIVDGYYNLNVSSSRNVVLGAGTGDSSHMYDVLSFGGTTSDHCYGCMGVGRSASHVYCSVEVSPSVHNVYYSYLLDNCSYCLGCIGLKNKSYCIFNKQYEKEERYEKVDKIFSQMEKAGELGSFFPGHVNPFYFNDTVAYFIDDSFTKEEVEAKGFLRRDEPITVDIPAGVQTVKVSELGKYEGWSSPHGNSGQAGSDGQKTIAKSQDSSLRSEGQDSGGQERRIDPEIMKKVIVDEEGNAYRVIPMEYEFLMKHELPLPRKHWLERIKQHFTLGGIN